MKVLTVKFGGFKGEWVGIKSDFFWGLGFPVMSKRITRRVYYTNVSPSYRVGAVSAPLSNGGPKW